MPTLHKILATSINSKDSETFERWIRYLPDNSLRTYMEWTTRAEWAEGTLILEREIAKRGLNSKNTSNRFSL